MKHLMIGTSWKMNKPFSEAMAYCDTLVTMLPGVLHSSIQPFFIPPFTAIQPVSDFFRHHHQNWLTGAQNMHQQVAGAWTGEISASMIAEAGATLVELGHSERRAAFNETDNDINQKVHTALAYGLRPLVCVGDTADEKRWCVSKETVIRQMKIALYGLTQTQVLHALVAYEPVWAIGEQGIPATPEQAAEIHHSLRYGLCEMFGEDVGKQIPLLYGGSVNLDNAVALVSQPNIDGLFIGRAAWDAAGYCAIVQRIAQEFVAKAQ